MPVASLIGAAALGLYIGLLAIKAWLSRRYADGHPSGRGADGAVTLLQPILSGDPFLETALRHILTVDPDRTRLLWLIDTDDHAARRLAASLADGTQDRVRILHCPQVPPGVNPKVFKLDYALPYVETPFVAVVDDDTLVTSESLEAARFHLEHGDVYTGLPYYRNGTTPWSALVAHFVNNNSILTYLPLLSLRPPLTLNGMFYVMRTATLRRLGGFRPIRHQVCDDYAWARWVHEHGGRIVQGTTPVALHTSVPDAGAYVALMHRWFVFARTLVADQPASTRLWLAGFLGAPPFLLWAAGACLLPSPTGCLALAAALGLRHAILRNLHRSIFHLQPAFSAGPSVLAELLQPIHLLHAALQHRIRWRNRHIRLERDGRMTYLPET